MPSEDTKKNDDIKSLMRKNDECKNNPEKSST